MTDETIDMSDPVKAAFAYTELRIKYERLRGVAEKLHEALDSLKGYCACWIDGVGHMDPKCPEKLRDEALAEYEALEEA